MPLKPKKKAEPFPLTQQELDAVTVVFHQYETGLREGTIYPKDLLDAMHCLGMNPSEQEIIDMHNEVERKGFIYFPDFAKLCHRKFRELDEENFRQSLFKNICGTEPFRSGFRAKKYKIHEKYFTKEEFRQMMTRLPVPVSDKDIDDMFAAADRNKDGKITYREFQTMITPPKPPEKSKLRVTNLHKKEGQLVDTSTENEKSTKSLAASKFMGLAMAIKNKNLPAAVTSGEATTVTSAAATTATATTAVTSTTAAVAAATTSATVSTASSTAVATTATATTTVITAPSAAAVVANDDTTAQNVTAEKV